MKETRDVMGGNAINRERKAGFSVRGVGAVCCLLETMVCECGLFSLYIHTHTPIKDPGFLSTVAMVTAPWIPALLRFIDMNSLSLSQRVLTSFSCSALIRVPTHTTALFKVSRSHPEQR